MKKILYTAIFLGGFALAFFGLRVIGNALVGIAGIFLCLYGLLEVMPLISSSANPPSRSMYAPLSSEEEEKQE